MADEFYCRIIDTTVRAGASLYLDFAGHPKKLIDAPRIAA
jgi:hypothetical protein